jgi:hypothetical protein
MSGREQALTALKSAKDRAELAREAEANGDHTQAKRLWRIVLGSDFPTNGRQPRSVACSRAAAHLFLEGCAVLLGAARRMSHPAVHTRL